MNTSRVGDHRSTSSSLTVPALDDDRFELGEVIGEGGMGTVHRAVQRSVGRAVAVKILAPEHAANSAGMSRFVREANVVARLNHPNIVQLIDFGRDRHGRMLLVMELLEGEPLRALLRREGRLAPDRAVWVITQVLNALRAAHTAGIVHRDLKPENVFIHHVGDDDHVKVLDFGVAKLLSSEPGDNDTSEGSLVGTLRYMAPEQVAGESPDPRVDVYATGVLLYEMLSAAMPFDTRDRLVLLRQIISEEPMHLAERAPWLPAGLADVVMGALAKDRQRRFQTADDFRRALQPFLSQGHAQLQTVSDGGARPSPAPSPALGDFRSGIVRSSQTHDSLRTAPPVSVSPTPSTRAPWIALGVVLFLAIPLTLFVAFARRHAAPDRTAAITRPLPVTPLPSAQPSRSQTQHARPALGTTRLVVLNTTPQGARVSDPSGTVLCLSTPCAIPVDHDGSRAVIVTLGATTLPATLDGRSEMASLDLRTPAALTPSVQPSQPVRPNGGQHTRPHRRERRGTESHSDDNLPMFLPGAH